MEFLIWSWNFVMGIMVMESHGIWGIDDFMYIKEHMQVSLQNIGNWNY